MKRIINSIKVSILRHKTYLIWAVITIFIYSLLSDGLRCLELYLIEKSEKEFISKVDTFFKEGDMVGYYNGQAPHVFKEPYPLRVDAYALDSVPVHWVIKDNEEFTESDYENQILVANSELQKRIKIVKDQDSLRHCFNDIRSGFHIWHSIDFIPDINEEKINLICFGNDSVPYYSSLSYPQTGYIMIQDDEKVIKVFTILSMVLLIISVLLSYRITKAIFNK